MLGQPEQAGIQHQVKARHLQQPLLECHDRYCIDSVTGPRIQRLNERAMKRCMIFQIRQRLVGPVQPLVLSCSGHGSHSLRAREKHGGQRPGPGTEHRVIAERRLLSRVHPRFQRRSQCDLCPGLQRETSHVRLQRRPFNAILQHPAGSHESEQLRQSLLVPQHTFTQGRLAACRRRQSIHTFVEHQNLKVLDGVVERSQQGRLPTHRHPSDPTPCCHESPVSFVRICPSMARRVAGGLDGILALRWARTDAQHDRPQRISVPPAHDRDER